jgi:hypothetical protein
MLQNSPGELNDNEFIILSQKLQIQTTFHVLTYNINIIKKLKHHLSFYLSSILSFNMKLIWN